MLEHQRTDELGAGARSRLETLRRLLGDVYIDDAPPQYVIAPAQNAADRINAVRAILPRCWFDAKACAQGIDALKQYQRKWDDNRKVFQDAPLHDWTSHAADAFSYGAITLRDVPPRRGRTLVLSAYNALDGIPGQNGPFARTHEINDYNPPDWEPSRGRE